MTISRKIPVLAAIAAGAIAALPVAGAQAGVSTSVVKLKAGKPAPSHAGPNNPFERYESCVGEVIKAFHAQGWWNEDEVMQAEWEMCGDLYPYPGKGPH